MYTLAVNSFYFISLSWSQEAFETSSFFSHSSQLYTLFALSLSAAAP